MTHDDLEEKVLGLISRVDYLENQILSMKENNPLWKEEFQASLDDLPIQVFKENTYHGNP